MPKSAQPSLESEVPAPVYGTEYMLAIMVPTEKAQSIEEQIYIPYKWHRSQQLLQVEPLSHQIRRDIRPCFGDLSKVLVSVAPR